METSGVGDSSRVKGPVDGDIRGRGCSSRVRGSVDGDIKGRGILAEPT